jgi:hypothetical protein
MLLAVAVALSLLSLHLTPLSKAKPVEIASDASGKDGHCVEDCVGENRLN